MTHPFDTARASILEELVRLEPGPRLERLLELHDELDLASSLSLPLVEEGPMGVVVQHVLATLSRGDLWPRLASILTFAAALEERTQWGWPELALLNALLPVSPRDLEAASLVIRSLDADVPGRLERVQQVLASTIEQEHATDDVGRPLYVGDDDQPTLERDAERWVRSEDGQPLFVSPVELPITARPLHRREVLGFTHLELWEHHFRQVPHGERRLEAWVRDPSHLVRRTIARAPWLRARQRTPEHDAARRGDLSLLLSEIVALEEILRPLDALSATSVLVDDDATSVLARQLRTDLGCLARTRRALHALCADLTVEVRPYRGLFSPLSEPLLEVAVRHPVGNLAVRWHFAAMFSRYAPLSDLRWPRRALIAALEAQLPRQHSLTDADLAALTRFVFDAEAMAERGCRAFLALAGESGADEARAMAEELAGASLTRAVRGLLGGLVRPRYGC